METVKPLISIIILNYNGANFLDGCISSVENANYPPERMQIIVVDNGSTDNSLSILEKYKPGITVIRNKINNCCLANNIGIKNSKGKFIVLLNNDVRVDREWLNQLLATINSKEDIGMVGSKILFEDGRIQSAGHLRFSDYTWADRGLYEKDQGQYEKVEEVESVSNCSAMYRAQALKETGLFDEDFMMYLEEVDMAIRMRKKGWKVYYSPKSKVYHRLHGSNQGAEKIGYYNLRNRIYVLIKHNPEYINSKVFPVKEIVRYDVSALDKYFIPIIDKIFKTYPGSVAMPLLNNIYSSFKENEDFIKFHLRAFYNSKENEKKQNLQIYKAFNNVSRSLRGFKSKPSLKHDLQRPGYSRARKQLFDIAVLVDNLSSYGGKEVYALECIKEWKKNNNVTIYTPFFNKKLLTDFDLQDIPVKVLSSAVSFESFYMLNMLFIIPKAWEDEIGKHDIYVIHSTNGAILPSISLEPSVVICHEPFRAIYDLRNFKYIPFKQKIGAPAIKLYGTSDYISINHSRLLSYLGSIHNPSEENFKECFRKYVTNSNFTAQYFKSICGITQTKTIYPGIQMVPKKYHLPKTKIRNVLFIGSLERHKQPDIAIKAMKYTSNARLIIIGQGSLKQELEELINQLKLGSKVQIYSGISTDKKKMLLKSSYCFLYIPIREPFGIAAVEAMSYAMPLIVSTDDAGYKEVLPKGSYISVDPEPSLIAEKINFLIANPEKAKQMGQIAWKASKKFTWQKTAENLLDLFHKTHDEYLNYSVLQRKHPKTNCKLFVGALYFAWYNSKTNAHWGDNPRYGNICDKPKDGLYSSADSNIISKHLEDLNSIGVDFISINWTVSACGISKDELLATKIILESIKRQNLNIKICILLSIYTANPQAINDALGAYSKISSSSSYFSFADKKLLFVFMTPSLFYSPFLCLKKFKQENTDTWLVAGSLFPIEGNMPEHMVNLFNGNYISSPLTFNGVSENFHELEKEYRTSCGRKTNIRIFSVSPGYDDRHLDDPDRKAHLFRHVPRKAGKVYKDIWKKALEVKPSPEIILIDSFNEYHETSHIEPSRKYGNKYMKITQEYIKKLRRCL
ncbi:MAG: glycosyltransferase [Candidatus Omnitrophica bacterium]|jgi:GT2 family glycosyltransferase|nr:glycosyltransferase [Candidatus Omnitrophota bacterium]